MDALFVKSKSFLVLIVYGSKTIFPFSFFENNSKVQKLSFTNVCKRRSGHCQEEERRSNVRNVKKRPPGARRAMRSPASALTRNKNMKIQNLISFLPSHRDRPPVRRCRRSICDGFSDGPEVQPDRFADTKTFSLRIFKKRSAHVLKGA